MSEKCTYCEGLMVDGDKWWRLDTSEFLQSYDFCSPYCLVEAIKTKWIEQFKN